MTAYLKILLGILSFCLGTVIGFFEVLALIDPVGTKLSDDADPFGNPYIPWQQHAAYIIFVLACFVLSCVLWRDDGKNSIKLK